jgi:hypothetical protein
MKPEIKNYIIENVIPKVVKAHIDVHDVEVKNFDYFNLDLDNDIVYISIKAKYKGVIVHITLFRKPSHGYELFEYEENEESKDKILVTSEKPFLDKSLHNYKFQDGRESLLLELENAFSKRFKDPSFIAKNIQQLNHLRRFIIHKRVAIENALITTDTCTNWQLEFVNDSAA